MNVLDNVTINERTNERTNEIEWPFTARLPISTTTFSVSRHISSYVNPNLSYMPRPASAITRYVNKGMEWYGGNNVHETETEPKQTKHPKGFFPMTEWMDKESEESSGSYDMTQFLEHGTMNGWTAGGLIWD